MSLRETIFGVLGIGILSSIYFLTSFSLVSATTITLPPNNLGLVGYWSLDDASGTTATDHSGQGNTGTLTNGPTWVDGKKGGALDFDGSNDYVTLPSSASFKGQDTATVSLWYKPDQNPSEEAGIYYESTSDSNYTRLGFFHNTSGDLAAVSRDSETGSAYAINQSDFFSAGEWYHLVMTYDAVSDEFILYTDGSQAGINTVSKGAFSGTSPGTSVVIGRYPSTYTPGYVNGQIDDVRIYNRALSATDISALYNSGTTKHSQVSETNLIGHWKFDDASGTTATDHSGNGNTGTLTNMDAATDWVSGKKGGALDFDGSNDYVSVSDNNLVRGRSVLTFSSWFKIDPSASVIRFLVEKGENSYFSLEAYSSLSPNFYINNTLAASYGVLQKDIWYNLVLTLDGATAKGYLNGVEVDSRSFSTTVPDNSNDITIGARILGANAGYFNGLIDDVRIYDTTLSATEIQAIYNENQVTINASQNNKLTDGLVGLWSFDGQDVAIVEGVGGGGYVVSGAGNVTYNGTYLESGTLNGQPRYRLDDTHWLAYLADYGFENWFLAPDQTLTDYPSYISDDNTILGSWEELAESGAPTVLEAGGSSSATTYDRSGQGNDGTLTNGPTPDRGIIGQGMRFDGVDDYVLVSNSTSLNPSHITMSAWVKVNKTTDLQTVVVKQNEPVGQYFIRIDDGQIGGGIHTGVWSFVLDSDIVQIGTWYHIVVTYDGSNIRLYKNSILIDTEPKTGDMSTTVGGMGIGQWYSFNTHYLDGNIDDVRIYNYSLSAIEVNRLYKLGARE